MAAPTLELRQNPERLAGLDLIGEHLGRFLPVRADPSPVAHQTLGPEQILLDHEGVEAPDALLWVDPVQHQMVLDRGGQLVRH